MKSVIFISASFLAILAVTFALNQVPCSTLFPCIGAKPCGVVAP